jgi:hypothetical protein
MLCDLRALPHCERLPHRFRRPASFPAPAAGMAWRKARKEMEDPEGAAACSTLTSSRMLVGLVAYQLLLWRGGRLPAVRGENRCGLTLGSNGLGLC